MAEQVRPPIVTILGHVDHGKTSLLDYIRKANVVATEHGGITQHIGAYQVEYYEGKLKTDRSQASLITFIDTPGHAAFEKMRSRGAKVADIAVLVVAIDDGIMPQTVEAIKHILEAKVPMIVAVNKVDLMSTLRSPDGDLKIDFTNPEMTVALNKIKKQLSDQKVLVEEYGGDVPVVLVSAKSGEGVDKLLEMILLVSELNELKADPNLPPAGVIIESHLDKFKGPVATILVRNGTLKKGDQILVGGVAGKIRGLMDYLGKSLDFAGPSTPVEVLGLNEVPPVGGTLGQEAIALEAKLSQSLIERLRQSETKVLGVVVKADMQGSLEAILDALEKFNAESEHVKVILSATGEINESDIKLAASTKAIVIGFNTKIVSAATKLAEHEHVLVRSYNIIYELIEELEDVVEGMLKIDQLEEVFGTAQIVAEFPYGKTDRIAGCKVLEGQFTKGPKVRIMRNEEVVAESKVKSLKHGKEEVTKVEKGEDCGMMFDPVVDFVVGDIVESYRLL